MGFAVELSFDSALEERLTQVWHTLAALNLGSFMLEVGATDLNVVFLAPVVTRALLDLHDEFYAGWKSEWGAPNPLYLPGNWVPHCTMAMEGRPEQVPDLFAAVRSSRAFGPAKAERIGLMEFRPVREIAEFRLVSLHKCISIYKSLTGLLHYKSCRYGVHPAKPPKSLQGFPC